MMMIICITVFLWEKDRGAEQCKIIGFIVMLEKDDMKTGKNKIKNEKMVGGFLLYIPLLYYKRKGAYKISSVSGWKEKLIKDKSWDFPFNIWGVIFSKKI